MPEVTPTEFRSALRARNRAAALHLFDPNVRLIDIGLKVQERQDRQLTDRLTVRVHLAHKPRGAAFEAFAARNPDRVIKAQDIGFPIDIIEAYYPLEWHWFSGRLRPLRAQLHNPLRGGISISTERSFGYGTLGGVVEGRATGDRMILSNWHVLAGSAFARKGLRIYQPGYGDGGRRQHTIAHLERHAMDQGIDAAVARLTEARLWINDQLDIGPVSGPAAPTIGLPLTKSGRASEVTQGLITGVGGLTKIPYGGFERTVRHVVHIAQVTGEGQVSMRGDSGSWWLEESSRAAVGLHFAGSNVPEYGLAIAMPQVLDALNVDLVTGVESGPAVTRPSREMVRV